MSAPHTPLLYNDLTDWYRLVDPPADHEEEAAVYADQLTRAASSPIRTLLELGAGAGNNALFLKRHFTCTLTDLSERMLALSRETNPDCEHHLGDMRTLRLGRDFDAVFVHDAVGYLTTIDDLRCAADTAFAHTRAGGVALFAPDYVRERFAESTNLISADDGPRSLRGLEWAWDPDPSDSIYHVEYAFVMRDGHDVRTAHDRHVEGLFSRDEWQRALQAAGYRVRIVDALEGDLQTQELFVCARPA
jgi:SAM-dependent methyltransferase